MIIGQQTIARQELSLPTNSQAINNMAAILEMLRRIDFDRSEFNVISNASGLHISLKHNAAELGYPWNNNGMYYCFGLTRKSANVITVTKGKAVREGDPKIGIVVGDLTLKPHYSAPDTDVTFGGDGVQQQIVAAWNPSGLTITPVAITGAVQSDSTTIRRVVAIFNVVGGYATLVDHIQAGPIPIAINTLPSA